MKASPKERKEPKAKAKAKAEPKAKAAASSSETSGTALPAADLKRFLSRASYTIANSKNEEERAAAESAMVEYRAAETREQKRSILERLQDCDGKFKFTGQLAHARIENETIGSKQVQDWLTWRAPYACICLFCSTRNICKVGGC